MVISILINFHYSSTPLLPPDPQQVIANILFSGQTGVAGSIADGVGKDLAHLTRHHYPNRLPTTERKQNPTKPCRVYTRRGINLESRFYCPNCPSHPGICLENCFARYHEHYQYSKTCLNRPLGRPLLPRKSGLSRQVD